MPTTANLYAIQEAAVPWLLSRLHPQAGQLTRPSWDRIVALLESRGETLFDSTPSGDALNDVWDYLDVVCDLKLSQASTCQLATELVALGYPGIYVISNDRSVQLSSRLVNVWIDEQEMRLLLMETYESDERCDVAAATGALHLLQSALERIRADQIGLLWFGQE